MSETCQSCGDTYTLRPECEPTGYCDLCAQTMLADLLKDKARLDRFNLYCRGHVRGTDYPQWVIQGNREDQQSGGDMNVREAIDYTMT
jgi:hypothetical protein